jgi:hypothetical protein
VRLRAYLEAQSPVELVRSRKWRLEVAKRAGSVGELEDWCQKPRADSPTLLADVNADEHEVPVRRRRVELLDLGKAAEELSGCTQEERSYHGFAKRGAGPVCE